MSNIPGVVKIPRAIRSTETRTFNGQGCPTQWFFEQRDKNNWVDLVPRSYYVRGTVGHAFIENGIRHDDFTAGWQAMEIAFEEAPEMQRDDWIETNKCTKEGLWDELVGLADTFEAQYGQDPYPNLHAWRIEETLEFQTPDRIPVSTTPDAIFLDEDNNRIIVDWKLGTSKNGSPLQLWVYWYGLRRLGLVPDSAYFRGWFHYVTYANPIEEVGDYPGDAFIEDYIRSAYERRNAGTWLPNPTWVDCRYCPYQDICPIYSGDERSWDEIRNYGVRLI